LKRMPALQHPQYSNSSMAVAHRVTAFLLGSRAVLAAGGRQACPHRSVCASAPGDAGVQLLQRWWHRSTLLAFPDEGEEKLGGDFVWLQGACRTAAGSGGHFERLSAPEPECRRRCVQDPLCLAWEFKEPDHCESHFEVVDHAEQSLPGYLCWIRAVGPQLPDAAPTPRRPPPNGLFTGKAGACRTSSGSPGTYTVVAADAAQCRERCGLDAGCEAFELGRSGRCELHREAITHADLGVQGYFCYTRVAPAPAPSAPALPPALTAPTPAVPMLAPAPAVPAPGSPAVAPPTAPTVGPVPVQGFRELQGACRTASGSTGSYDVVNVGGAGCRGRCTSDPSCVAFERGPADRCELHREAVDHAEAAARGYACWVRASPATPAPTPAPAPAGSPAPSPSPTPAPSRAPIAPPILVPMPEPTSTPTVAPSPTWGSDPCSDFREEPRVAVSGIRLRFLDSKSQAQCCQECNLTPGCDGFTFLLSGQALACRLWANVGRGRHNYYYPGIVSGVKRTVSTTMRPW